VTTLATTGTGGGGAGAAAAFSNNLACVAKRRVLAAIAASRLTEIAAFFFIAVHPLAWRALFIESACSLGRAQMQRSGRSQRARRSPPPALRRYRSMQG
jgi:hypothetical protein